MAEDPHAGIVRQHALGLASRELGAVHDDHLARVDGTSDPDAPTVVDAYPRGSARGVDQSVAQRPGGGRTGTTGHRLGPAVRRPNAAGIEVVAPDHDRRLEFAAR